MASCRMRSAARIIAAKGNPRNLGPHHRQFLGSSWINPSVATPGVAAHPGHILASRSLPVRTQILSRARANHVRGFAWGCKTGASSVSGDGPDVFLAFPAEEPKGQQLLIDHHQGHQGGHVTPQSMCPQRSFLFMRFVSLVSLTALPHMVTGAGLWIPQHSTSTRHGYIRDPYSGEGRPPGGGTAAHGQR